MRSGLVDDVLRRADRLLAARGLLRCAHPVDGAGAGCTEGHEGPASGCQWLGRPAHAHQDEIRGDYGPGAAGTVWHDGDRHGD